MGAFYGSVQVRSEDRDRVKAAAEEVARRRQLRMLIGPVLGGWIGVYPEGSGQDDNVSREIAQCINGDVLHFLVHDDDIFAYWLYRGGRAIDSFHSRPGYFGNENRAEEEHMVGNAEAFRPLIGDRVEQLRPLLVREGRPWRMESERLDNFAKVFGISNALASYEYLKEDDHQGIKGWRKFEEIPADENANAKERKRRAKELLKSEVKKLKAEGLLLDRKLCRDEMPDACGLAQHLFVAWANFRKDTVTFNLYKAPRKNPEPIALNASRTTWMTVSDSQGRRVAMAARGRVQVWDFDGATWTHVCDIAAPESVGELAISADGKLVAHSSQTQTVVTDVASGRPVLEIPDHEFEEAKFHPSGDWLAISSGRLTGRLECALISVHKEPHWRPIVQKPKPGAEWPLVKAARLLKRDVETLIERSRQLGENLTSVARQVRSGFEDPLVVEQAAKLAQMQADWAAIQRGEPPRPEPVQGTWSVGFSRDGRWFWRGTARGLYIYEWATIHLEKAAELPDPTWSFELPSINEQPFQMVYAIAEEPDAQAVVFGGMTGRLYRLDLKSGAVHELIKLPGDCHILMLAFANDGATLGIAAKAHPLSFDATEYLEEGTIWEVWNYPRLRDGEAVASEAP
jgi:hypothetical protein